MVNCLSEDVEIVDCGGGGWRRFYRSGAVNRVKFVVLQTQWVCSCRVKVDVCSL